MRAAGKVPFYAALLIAGLAFAITVRFNGFVAPYTDPSGYMAAGARWLSGEIQKPVHFQFQPQFPHYLNMGSPLGFRPGATSGTDVGEYPLGLPVFMAAAMAVFGEAGAYLMGPFLAALLAWCTYRLGAALAGPWAGVIAALLISASPVTLRHSVYVSSDVPCTAFWMLAWLLSMTPRTGAAAAAGAAVTAAVMIRPNTAPLALIPAVLILLNGAVSPSPAGAHPDPLPDSRWRRAVAFGNFAAIGVALVLWSNTMLFGGPLEAGYKGAADFFRWAHVALNLKLYPSWLFEVHSVAAVAGLAALPVAWWRARRSAGARPGFILALSALAMIAVNLAIIVPYLNFQQWTYLRFVLPAMAALFVLLGALLVWLAQGLARVSRLVAPLAAIPAALVLWQGVPEARAALREWRATSSILVMGHYLRHALPANTVLMSYTHSGTVGVYTRYPLVRLDIIQPELDSVIARLRSQGYRPLLVIDEVIESPHVARIFPTSSFNKLDWPPRASFEAFGRIWLLDPADRAAHQAGVKYATDILR